MTRCSVSESRCFGSPFYLQYLLFISFHRQTNPPPCDLITLPHTPQSDAVRGPQCSCIYWRWKWETPSDVTQRNTNRKKKIKCLLGVTLGANAAARIMWESASATLVSFLALTWRYQSGSRVRVAMETVNNPAAYTCALSSERAPVKVFIFVFVSLLYMSDGR